ncbi:MAG TPA: flagellar basal body L-ring protein FlgH [Thermotogota bacterium]|nr:flagellar basal body L-ring protein FlgH [Thermotogota bacterium]HPJ89180.1 flagellar basal body L-ring protein FlgH [Thermotogota bacterium]HPR95657.1 flagellar basal body L-ring protein FlgH [Thermotogota bacterium]
MKNRLTFLILISLILFSSCFSTSLWNNSQKDNFKSLYTDNKAYQIGDILTILVSETVSLTQNDSSDDKKKGLITSAVSFIGSVGNLALETFIPINADADQRVQTENSAESQVITKIAATIVDVDQNGNLLIQGKKETKVGQDKRELLVQGRVRPTDITADNTIDSFKIADAKIWYNGDVVFEQDPSEQSWIGYILSGISGVIF